MDPPPFHLVANRLTPALPPEPWSPQIHKKNDPLDTEGVKM